MLEELLHNIGLCITVLKGTILVGILRIVSYLPYIKERVQRYEERYNLVPYEHFWDDYAGTNMLATVLKIMVGDYNKTARLGSSAPNCKVVTLDGEECRLLDFVRGSRPLVLNFGSCS